MVDRDERSRTVRETLVALYKLQQIDTKVLEIERSGSQFPARIKEKEAQLDALRSALGALKSELEAKKKERGDAEGTIREDGDKLQKWKRRLVDIKTPREYQALSREVEGVERGIRELEEKVLAMMQEIEAKQVVVTEKETELRAVEGEVLGQIRELRERMAVVTKEALEARSARGPIAQQLPPKVLQLYDRVRERRQGVAVAIAAGGNCTACNVAVRPQLLVTVRKLESLETCPSCSRILVIDSLVMAPPAESSASG